MPPQNQDKLSIFVELQQEIRRMREEVLASVNALTHEVDNIRVSICGKLPPDGSSAFERLTMLEHEVRALKESNQKLKDRLMVTATVEPQMTIAKMDNRTKLLVATVAILPTVVTVAIQLLGR